MSQYDELMQTIVAKLDQHGGSFRSLEETTQARFIEQSKEIARLGDDLADSNKRWGARFAAVANGEFGGGGGRPYGGYFRDAEQARQCGRFLRAVCLGDAKGISEFNRAAVEPSTGGGGGYLAGPAFISELIANFDRFGLFERVRPFMDVGSREFVQPKAGNPASVFFPDFGVAVSESALTFKSVRGTLPRWSSLVMVDRWLLQDQNAIPLATYVMESLSRALAQRLDESVFIGDGSPTYARITGAFKTPNAGSVVAASGDDTFQEVIDESTRYLGQAVGTLPEWAEGHDPRFFMHRTILWAYMSVRDTQGRPIADIFLNPEGIARPQLMGYPVETTSVAPKLTDTAVSTTMLIFAAMQAAYGAYRFAGGIEFDTLTELKRLEGQVAVVADVLQTVVEKDATAVVQLKTAAS